MINNKDEFLFTKRLIEDESFEWSMEGLKDTVKELVEYAENLQYKLKRVQEISNIT